MLLVLTTVIELRDEHFERAHSDETVNKNVSNVLEIANSCLHEELRNEYGKPTLRRLTSSCVAIPDGERVL